MTNMVNKGLKMVFQLLMKTLKLTTKDSLAVIASKEILLIFSKISSEALILIPTSLLLKVKKMRSNCQKLKELQLILKLFLVAPYLNSTTVPSKHLLSIEISCNLMEDRLIRKKLK